MEASKITEKTGVMELLEYAKNELKNIKRGEEFLVRDLFKGYEWARLTRATRIAVGSMFLLFAKDNKKLVKVSLKNAQNQQQYKKN